MTGHQAVARVLIDSPLPQLDRLFDYEVPAALAEDCRVGVRVRVPLRSMGRIADGFVVELGERGDYSGALSLIEEVVSPVPVLPPALWQLARRLADRAAGCASDVLRFAVPKRYVRAEKAWLAADSGSAIGTREAVSVAGYGHSALHDLVKDRRRVAIDAIPRIVAVTDPLAGKVEGADSKTAPRPAAGRGWVGHWAATAAAAATHALAQGVSAIISVPDYRDLDQVTGALAAVLPSSSVVRLDSNQTGSARYRSYLRCLEGDPVVVVGNRSAVFAPVGELGLIIVWDDGDQMHTEQHAPYVHTRDVALVRQEQEGCALAFLGHARSTEVQRLVEIGWLGEIRPERVFHPKVVLTAAMDIRDAASAGARIPTQAWQLARAALAEGPVLIQVARPGYAPHLACQGCGSAARCTVCQGPLAKRSAGSTPACGWCGALARSWRCAVCEGGELRMASLGSRRTAEDLGRAFPGARVVVSDGERPLMTVDDSPALVVATRGSEPIAAGGYRAILLLDGERMLARESLRVAEECIRSWSNAVALAAPGASAVLVGVGGSVGSSLSTWNLAGFASQELADRRRLRFAPAVRMATLHGTPAALESVLAETSSIVGVDVLGPVADEGGQRAVLRFDYGVGGQVAAVVKSEVIRAAINRQRRVPATKGGPTGMPRLRAHFDVSEPLIE